MGNSISIDEFKDETFGTMILLLAPQLDRDLQFISTTEGLEAADINHMLPMASTQDDTTVLDTARCYYNSDRKELIDKYVAEHIMDTQEHRSAFISTFFNKLQPRKMSPYRATLDEIRKQRPQLVENLKAISSPAVQQQDERSNHTQSPPQAQQDERSHHTQSPLQQDKRSQELHQDLAPAQVVPSLRNYPWQSETQVQDRASHRSQQSRQSRQSQRQPHQESSHRQPPQNKTYQKLSRKMGTLNNQIDNEALALELYQQEEQRSADEDRDTVDGEYEEDTYNANL